MTAAGAALVCFTRRVASGLLEALMGWVVEELIPEAHGEGQHSDVATVGAMLGFAVMTVLDVALG
jgi:ZIP family zinc transporter